MLAEGALGRKGARYIISTLLAIACVGWFGIQSATCGQAFATMTADMLGLGAASPAMVVVSSIVWGVIMLVTACAGFKGLKWLNYLAVPLLVVVCLYGLIAGIVRNDGASAIMAYAPEQSSGMVFGISMVVASFALGGVISADYCRFAKSRADVVKSSILGVIPAGLFMLLTGALMSIVTGQYDISAILASLGVPLFGLIALVLATWTTNVTNAYSGGLALSNLLGFDESRFKITTGIAGGIGTLLAAFGLLNAFQGFLSLMSALIPPLAGVIIAGYWVVGRGRLDRFQRREGFSAPRRDRLPGGGRPGLHHRRHLRQLPRPGGRSPLAEHPLLCGAGERHCGIPGALYGAGQAYARPGPGRGMTGRKQEGGTHFATDRNSRD